MQEGKLEGGVVLQLRLLVWVLETGAKSVAAIAVVPSGRPAVVLCYVGHFRQLSIDAVELTVTYIYTSALVRTTP